MPDVDRTYSAVEHAAYLDAEVKRATAETAAANQKLETEKAELAQAKAGLEKANAELLTRIDTIEAEKAAAVTATANAQKELADFKASTERAAEVAKLRGERKAEVAAVLTEVGEEYFTEARTQRWAQMAAEEFAAVLADFTESAAATDAAKKKKKAPEDKSDPAEPDEDDKTQKASLRETAAFRGGADPKSATGTTFAQLMAARRAG